MAFQRQAQFFLCLMGAGYVQNHTVQDCLSPFFCGQEPVRHPYNPSVFRHQPIFNFHNITAVPLLPDLSGNPFPVGRINQLHIMVLKLLIYLPLCVAKKIHQAIIKLQNCKMVIIAALLYSTQQLVDHFVITH